MGLSIRDLERGRRIAALVVRHCGQTYFPLFDRFDREYQHHAGAAERLAAVLGRDTPEGGRRVNPVAS